MQILQKSYNALIRFKHAIIFLPVRGGRLLGHLAAGLLWRRNPMCPELPINRVAGWWVELCFMLIDIVGVPEIYETFLDFYKWKTRVLSEAEIKIAISVFGNSINYEKVRVDETAQVVCRRYNVYYVSFFTINSWGDFKPEIFIHEMMHIWQFQNLGSVYIPRALLAQLTQMGYNYGGTEALLKAIALDAGFTPFNLEQQAEIISDYFCLREGLNPNWCSPHESNLIPLFEYFIKKL